nr:YidB family protein [Streptomyces fulvoviolaceus]
MAGNDLGSLLGGVLGGSQAGGSGGNIPGALLDMLAESGLAEQKDSWVGTGANQSVTGAQIQQALPDETLQQVAEQAGVTPDQAADELAQVLPRAVDKLTPGGQVPASLDELVKQQSLQADRRLSVRAPGTGAARAD